MNMIKFQARQDKCGKRKREVYIYGRKINLSMCVCVCTCVSFTTQLLHEKKNVSSVRQHESKHGQDSESFLRLCSYIPE